MERHPGKAKRREHRAHIGPIGPRRVVRLRFVIKPAGVPSWYHAHVFRERAEIAHRPAYVCRKLRLSTLAEPRLSNQIASTSPKAKYSFDYAKVASDDLLYLHSPSVHDPKASPRSAAVSTAFRNEHQFVYVTSTPRLILPHPRFSPKESQFSLTFAPQATNAML